MNILPLRKPAIVFAFLVAVLLQLLASSKIFAGTTGNVTGVVVGAETHKPIAGARVTAASTSQRASTVTDASGHFAFLSLAPDTYTISVEPSNDFDGTVLTGITVQADQSLTETIAQQAKLKTIGRVTSRSASSLVRPGTTADVYSIGVTQQDKASQLGGGGAINSAWSALTSVPGVFVAPNQNGYIGAAPALSIRGGDYDQIGYELDGIPVNRSFDNYPSNSLPSLGQQELQVYTGASPANAEATGLAGYINQVIKSGTLPGFETLTLATGGPAFYHKFSAEIGGANPSRTFSYYVGLGGYDQDFRYGDQFNGPSVATTWGVPVQTCGAVPSAKFTPAIVPSCFTANGTPYNASTPSYVLRPLDLLQTATVRQRDTVTNVHFGIPHKDGTKDDIQVLLDINHLDTLGFSSPNDGGGAAYLNAIGLGTPTYADGYQAAVPYGTLLPAGYRGGGGVVAPYLFPGSPAGRAAGAPIFALDRDAFANDQNIFKLQYQHNFGTKAYARIYGYTYYSDWLQYGPNGTVALFGSFQSPDYELNSHSAGLSASFADQIDEHNLVSLQGSYTTSAVTRYNNSGIGFGPDTTVGYLVNGNDPFDGVAYTLAGTPVPGAQYNAAGLPFQKLTVGQVLSGSAGVPAPGVTCGGGPCRYEIVAGGPSATYNQVRPKFTSASITDAFRPTDKLDVNIGLRYDLFKFAGSNTFDSGARTFFYNAYNSQAAANGVVPLAFDPTGAGNTNVYPVIQPRFGMTYALNGATVVRASYGRYAQAPNTAFEQYNYLQPNALAKFIGFGANGLPTTPGHDVRPAVSNNYDLSFEREFAGNTSVKLTPFLRKTQDQLQNFFLDQRTGFLSGLNVGNQTSEGAEFELDRGNFARDGVSAKLSFTYTNSYIRYNRTPSGTSVVDPINAAIAQFNRYTKAGGGFPYYSTANATTGAAGAGSFTGGPGFVANPYYNAPLAGLLDPSGNYPTFNIFPGGIGSTSATFGAPYVSTLLVQYKRGPLSVTPSLQFNAGQRYGIPENTPGIAPDQIAGVLPGTTTGDPRYATFGSPGLAGSPYDATTAQTTLAIPDPYTRRFDGLGQFVQPSFLQANLQLAYDLSKRITVVGTLTNLYTGYFGGSKPGWQVKGSQGYGLQCNGCGGVLPAGNVYNPGAPLQPYVNAPYIPQFYGAPFSFFIETRVKI